MKQYEIKNFKTAYNDMGNLFNVYQDEDGNYSFSINRTLNLGTDQMYDGFYSTYELEEDMFLTTLSYRFYKTIDLWWLICKTNGISDPTLKIAAGTRLKIPSSQVAKFVVDEIRKK